MEITFFELGAIKEEQLAYVVVVCHYKGKLLFCKNKARAWEIPGGHIEPGECAAQAAARELYEETGALQYTIKPVCAYRLSGSYGAVYHAEIETLGPLPPFEMESLGFFNTVPTPLSFPQAHPFIVEQVIKRLPFC
ncbi:NUDIX domain-containing protein [Ruminococcaceae bacterium OttesenSCG-928-N02]|nr:NUDIX domain-containing protein [Ruminococcaceae bacterium OttesenSCG-928-N02]